MGEQSRVALHVLETALASSVVRLERGPPGKCRGELGKIDRFDLEQRDAESGQAGKTGAMPACKGELEDIGEHGRMIQGVISWHCSRCG